MVVDHASPQRRHLFGHRGTPVAGLHKRAIFSDRVFSCDEHFPIVSYSQGSRNGDCATYREWLY
jgi:hypothetical protein